MAETEIFALPGKLDCWRASKSALQPVQFMCTTNGTAATDVLAIWPMNAQNGIYIDGTDVATGAYTFEEPLGLQYMATACDGAPEVPGVSTASNGSAAFRVDGNGSRWTIPITFFFPSTEADPISSAMTSPRRR